MRSSRLQNVAAGLGSRISSNDFWRKTMLLMVETGELACEAVKPRSVLLAREDADDDVDDVDSDRRNEVRRLCGEKRAVMAWKREVCIVSARRQG
ncbi:b46bb0b0-6a0a-4e96-98fb-81886a2e45d2 [Thermothielavioides terrestris]|uniref:B46bb0b0-6a0a-4e96-98fb-81886a2e45d2 n=1 Tax=Thermothielavioides terrestris TaxID=2587410 RepID=A0A3S4D0A9_9PEZI|nr:b46bb0b0-6a0a-4e96-98fb-81886a2e45d2 [Thermothielavioides terrestris]